MHRRAVFGLAFLLLAAATAANAEEVVELWRSRYGQRHGWALDFADNSLWRAEGATLTHLSAEGALLSRSEGLGRPRSLAADPGNGSCWALLDGREDLVHLAGDGTLLSVTPGHDGDSGQLTASPADGSVWVYGKYAGYVARVDSSGQETWRREDLACSYLVVDPEDGSAWTVDSAGTLLHFRADGGVVWQVAGLGAYAPVADDPQDQSVWTASASGELTHVSSQGAVLWQAGVTDLDIRHIFVSAVDGSLLVSSGHYTRPLAAASIAVNVVRLDGSGEEMWSRRAAVGIGINYPDGSAWIALAGEPILVRVSAEGTDLGEVPLGVATSNPYDGSLWTAKSHVAMDGTVLWQDDDWYRLYLPGQTLDLRDGSVWARDEDDGDLVHLSADGAVLERRPKPDPESVFAFRRLHISPFDSTWWVVRISPAGQLLLVRLAEDGTELWRCRDMTSPVFDPADGSVWTTFNDSVTSERGTTYSAYVYHLRSDGLELGSRHFRCRVTGVAPDSADSSAWVARGHPDPPRLVHLSREGEVLEEVSLPGSAIYVSLGGVWLADGSVYGRGESIDPETSQRADFAFRVASDGSFMWLRDDLGSITGMALDPADGSVWLTCKDALVLLDADGVELWRGDTLADVSNPLLDPVDGSLWLSDAPNWQVVHLGRRFSPFADLSLRHWAASEVLACVSADIVAGYGDGLYHPELAVTRAQMAVYIARALEAPSGEAALADWVPADPANFPDVPSDHWAYTYIEYCVENGVAAGYDDDLYHPEYEVTRDQMAVYVARALVAPEGEAGLADYVPADPRDFPDVPSDHWAYTHIEYCVENGVVSGYLDGSYHPDEIVTRDQMAVYVARAFGLTM